MSRIQKDAGEDPIRHAQWLRNETGGDTLKEMQLESFLLEGCGAVTWAARPYATLIDVCVELRTGRALPLDFSTSLYPCVQHTSEHTIGQTPPDLRVGIMAFIYLSWGLGVHASKIDGRVMARYKCKGGCGTCSVKQVHGAKSGPPTSY